MNRMVKLWSHRPVLLHKTTNHHHFICESGAHNATRPWRHTHTRTRASTPLEHRKATRAAASSATQNLTSEAGDKTVDVGRKTSGAFDRPRRIAQVLETNGAEGETEVFGWVRSSRAQKSVAFIDVSDGSCASGLQVVASLAASPAAHALVAEGKCPTGASVRVKGKVVESRAKGQKCELQATEIEVLGECSATDYPLQKKKHSLEFLRNIAHLRPRTRTIQSMARVRSTLTQSTHEFFEKHGFTYVNTPIITRSDCEGAGEAFRITTDGGDGAGEAEDAGALEATATQLREEVAGQGLAVKEAKAKAKEVGENPNAFAKDEIAKLLELKARAEEVEGRMASLGSGSSGEEDFFGGPAFLTVSGQLEAETYACAVRDVYTFGPTFRAENSNTQRHLAEFWMLEPELAFADLDDVINCSEAYIRFCIGAVLEKNGEDVAFFSDFVSEGREDLLRHFLACDWHRITYTEAIDCLLRSVEKGEAKFEYPVAWGSDLQTEHERFLCERIFQGTPVYVTDYPKDIKAFYMRLNDDGKTVSAVDLLVPGIGELVGGSAREERIDLLDEVMEKHGVTESLWWYRDLRKYGTVKHAGFGLGFERLVQLVTGLENIRDVTPFPRYPGHAEF